MDVPMTTPAERAARATLIALRSIVRLSAAQLSVNRTIIEPEPALLSEEEAIARLASLQKPACCRGEAVGDVLRIERLPARLPKSVPLQDGRGWTEISFAEWMDRQVEEELAGVRAAHGGVEGEIVIAVEGNGESVVLSMTEFDRWCREYVLWNAFGSRTDGVNPEELGDGATVLHRVAPGDEPA